MADDALIIRCDHTGVEYVTPSGLSFIGAMSRAAFSSGLFEKEVHGCTVIILSALQRFMKDSNDRSFSTFDRNHERFKGLRRAFDSLCRQLRTEGIGAKVKAAGVISDKEEDLMWSTGALGTDTPIQLIRAVFFKNGKNFALHCGDEYRSLKWSQLTRCSFPKQASSERTVGYVYTEHVPKTMLGDPQTFVIQ